jgi:hypothetical protein
MDGTVIFNLPTWPWRNAQLGISPDNMNTLYQIGEVKNNSSVHIFKEVHNLEVVQYNALKERT